MTSDWTKNIFKTIGGELFSIKFDGIRNSNFRGGENLKTRDKLKKWEDVKTTNIRHNQDKTRINKNK